MTSTYAFEPNGTYEPFPTRAEKELAKLEDLSYQYAQEAGEAEWRMWEVLAQIRDSNLWSTSGHATFREYMHNWLIEASYRTPNKRALPWSLRYAWDKLGLHRRLVSGMGLEPQLVLGASPDVLNKFCRAIGNWDTKTGELRPNPRAQAVLDEQYPGLGLPEQIARAVDDITAEPIVGKAMDMIDEQYGPPEYEKSLFRYKVTVCAGLVETWVEHTVLNIESGEVMSAQWYTAHDSWPTVAIDDYCKRLSTGPIEE